MKVGDTVIIRDCKCTFCKDDTCRHNNEKGVILNLKMNRERYGAEEAVSVQTATGRCVFPISCLHYNDNDNLYDIFERILNV